MPIKKEISAVKLKFPESAEVEMLTGTHIIRLRTVIVPGKIL
jgi:hypothetical protein